MKKSMVLLALVVILLSLTAAPALARWSWCAADPEIILPDGQGTMYVWVGVPETNRGANVTLYLEVPAGSQVINHEGDVNVNVVLTAASQPNNRVIARVDENIPVQLSAFYNGDALRVFTFEDGRGTGRWHW